MHYDGWDAKWDHWVPVKIVRVAKTTGLSKPPQPTVGAVGNPVADDELKPEVGDLVQVFTYRGWVNGKILNTSMGFRGKKFLVNYDGWADKYDESVLAYNVRVRWLATYVEAADMIPDLANAVDLAYRVPRGRSLSTKAIANLAEAVIKLSDLLTKLVAGSVRKLGKEIVEAIFGTTRASTTSTTTTTESTSTTSTDLGAHVSKTGLLWALVRTFAENYYSSVKGAAVWTMQTVATVSRNASTTLFESAARAIEMFGKILPATVTVTQSGLV